jgi:hypothetical protein
MDKLLSSKGNKMDKNRRNFLKTAALTGSAAPFLTFTNSCSERKAEKFECIDGVTKVSSGTGLGVKIDPEYINKHKLISL